MPYAVCGLVQMRVREPGASMDSEAPMEVRPPLVLVADDDRDVRLLCNVALELAGMDVLEACNGREALDLARTHRPNLVLLDVYMPVMDGWECLAHARADSSLDSVRVVVMTVKSEPGIDLHALQLGADDYVSKPFHPDALIRAVRRTLSEGTQQREDRRRSAITLMERLQRL